jgi:hypothetical protein
MSDVISRNESGPSRLALVAVLAIAAVAYMWAARQLFLDDAFIHLRIAENLRHLGIYSFNGDAPAYCTSSPLYTALLAGLLTFYDGVLLPKIVSVIIYVALFGMVARSAVAAKAAEAQWLWLALLAAIASPLGVRWLSDGMETGLVGAIAVVFARAAFNIWAGAKVPAATLVGYGALALFATLLRIEFSYLVAAIGIASLAGDASRRINPLALSMAAGAATALAAIYLVFGAILPDTAVAKAAASGGLTVTALVGTLIDVAKVHVAASTLSVLVFAAWSYSLVRLVLIGGKLRIVLILNAALPVLIALVALRQQAVQGYRYFVFVEFFLVAFNAAVLSAGGLGSSHGSQRWFESWSPRTWAAASGIVAVLVAWQLADYLRLARMIEGRSASLQRFRSLDLHELTGTEGIAWDVGMIGYFTQATILDGNGLVDGRKVARMSKAERLKDFAGNHHISFVFANDEQLRQLRDVMDVRSWEIRGTFEFPNFSGQPDRHTLLTRRDNTGPSSTLLRRRGPFLAASLQPAGLLPGKRGAPTR